MDTHGFALIAAGVILFGLVSRKLEGTIITAPMVFAAFGLLIGEAVFGLADLDFGHGFIHGLAEVTLILVLFSDAALGDFEGRVTAVGPTVSANFQLGPVPVAMTLRYFHEFNVRNRLEGDAGWLTISIPLWVPDQES